MKARNPLELLRDRPNAAVGALLGATIAGIIWRGENTRTDQAQIKNRVIKVEAHTPCLNLTASECAIKLFRALPREQRKRIRISEKTLRSLAKRAQRERQVLRSRGGSPPQTGSQRAGGGSPGGSPGGISPSPGTRPPGSSPDQPSTPTPAPAQQPSPVETEGPLVQTPQINTPQVGPVPTIVIPPITVPCSALKPLINCK